MHLGAEYTTARARLGLTPLIDVVFILLVFFMLASSFLDWRALDLSVSTPGGRAAAEPDPMLIQVAADGSLRRGGRPLVAEALQRDLGVYLAEDPGRTVLVQPLAGVPLQMMLDAFDRLRAAGAKSISLFSAAEDS